MKGGLGNIVRQAQKMQAQMQQIQEEMANKTVEASSGGGMVKAVVNGKQEILAIKIEPEVVNPSDVEMLQDLIVAAVNEGIKRSQAMMSEEMGKVTGGLGVPGLSGLF
ncbi:MAG: YbaB/EbfC family nucleoid-associated protein [Deltaproteobacteria bacterium]|nr:YbaB/EbfC family nucleoid-associated protein [Deltaproteobacteria bacterium]